MRLRAATLNTWGLPEPFALDTQARAKSIGRQLAALDLDIIAFQEVWTSDARKALVKAGREAGLVHYQNRASIGNSGLLTLSRFPIESPHFEHFALRGTAGGIRNGEYLSGKGFARLRIQTDDGPLTIINTHLHARYPQRVEHEYQGHRIGQIIQIAASNRDCNEPLIVLGDFNFIETHPEYAILKGLMGMSDAAAELDARQPTVYAENPYRLGRTSPNKRIDFAFYRGGEGFGMRPVAVSRVFDDFFTIGLRPAAHSNHAGVLTEFETDAAQSALAATPDLSALELARRLLREGIAEAEQRRVGDRTWAGAGAGIGCAAIAALATRNPVVSRRAILRNSLKLTAVASLTPAAAWSALSEIFLPEEIQAFNDAAADLDQLHEATQGDPEIRIT
jgi:endonuclease/exonuclease/phosphatase family metal-dependent hydrolase